MASQLLLKRFGVEHMNFQFAGAYRLRIEASAPAGNDTDPYVFLYQQGVTNPYTHITPAYYAGTCSPVDMSEYPVGEPNDQTTYPMFRTSWIEMDLRRVDLAHYAWILIVREVDELLKTLDRLEALVLQEEVLVGDSPVPADSDSSTGSDSTSNSSSASG